MKCFIRKWIQNERIENPGFLPTRSWSWNVCAYRWGESSMHSVNHYNRSPPDVQNSRIEEFIAVSKVLENLDKPARTVSTSFRIAVINQYGEQNCVTVDKSVWKEEQNCVTMDKSVWKEEQNCVTMDKSVWKEGQNCVTMSISLKKYLVNVLENVINRQGKKNKRRTVSTIIEKRDKPELKKFSYIWNGESFCLTMKYLLKKFRKSQTRFSTASRKISLQSKRISKRRSGKCCIDERRESIQRRKEKKKSHQIVLL